MSFRDFAVSFEVIRMLQFISQILKLIVFVAKNKHKIVAEKREEKDFSNFEKWMMYLMPSR